MSRLTVTEKEHWKSRIENRINKVIEAIEARHAKQLQAIRKQAESQAYETLGIAEYQAELKAIKRDLEELQTKEYRTKAAMHHIVLGDVKANSRSPYYIESEFDKCLGQQRKQHEDELLQASEPGREIRRLQAEKDSLLDTVWLATSSLQIRNLWSRVSDVLGDDATELQQRILSQEATAAAD